MFWGVMTFKGVPTGTEAGPYSSLPELPELGALPVKGSSTSQVWFDQKVTLYHISAALKAVDDSPHLYISDDGGTVALFEGKIYNTGEIIDTLQPAVCFPGASAAELIVRLYKKYGDSFPQKLNGKFAFALWDSKAGKLLLGRDHLGMEPLYYSENDRSIVFGNSLRGMVQSGLTPRKISYDALMQYLLYCYNPGDETLVENVYKVPPGHVLSQIGPSKMIRPYWRLSFAEQETRSISQYKEEILPLIEDAVRIRLEPDSMPGVFLSGGTDSSALVSLASKILHAPFPTFSFRCAGKSYDESCYARLVAKRYGTVHNEIPYSPDQLALIFDAVKFMDEPFCDVGIEIGTYVLGKTARGMVSYTLSGEGGDELFGGHPVYTADKVAAFADHLPSPVIAFMNSIFKGIPDSNQKKDLSVMAKRFAYGLSFPRQLLSHRWRIYYTPEELSRLCTAELFHECEPLKLYAPMLKHMEGADGKDILSRSLYGEYTTLVDFYLRRLGLLKAFSIDPRLPLMDVRLVEYAAHIPSHLKLKGFSDTKHIYRKVLEDILPREILYDRPKLGHSVPLKNWIRDDPKIFKMIREVLVNSALNREHILNGSYIERLLKEHAQKLHNHSHRLWGLTVLGLWIQDLLQG